MVIVDAVAHGGKIKRVEFFNGPTLIHTEENLPYLWAWKNVPAGTYILTAKATDSYGRVTSSAPVSITVRLPAVSSAGRKFSAGAAAGAGQDIDLQLTPNPAGGILNIYPTGLQKNQVSTLSLISSSGVMVKTIRISSSKQPLKLNVSTLTGGMCIVKMISGSKIIYRQFLKM